MAVRGSLIAGNLMITSLRDIQDLRMICGRSMNRPADHRSPRRPSTARERWAG